jgi:hypothetical protein
LQIARQKKRVRTKRTAAAEDNLHCSFKFWTMGEASERQSVRG